jgi:hypothetical protein
MGRRRIGARGTEAITMAYLNFSEATAGPSTTAPRTAPFPAERASFGALEWQVIALARRDGPLSLRRPGRLSTALGSLFGGHKPRLADPRLEALRRIAVLSWRRGYSVAPHEVRAFIEAGFTPDQYELLLDSIEAARLPRAA